jgi:hypothetical protein
MKGKIEDFFENILLKWSKGIKNNNAALEILEEIPINLNNITNDLREDHKVEKDFLVKEPLEIRRLRKERLIWIRRRTRFNKRN